MVTVLKVVWGNPYILFICVVFVARIRVKTDLKFQKLHWKIFSIEMFILANFVKKKSTLSNQSFKKWAKQSPNDTLLCFICLAFIVCTRVKFFQSPKSFAGPIFLPLKWVFLLILYKKLALRDHSVRRLTKHYPVLVYLCCLHF